MEMTGCAIYAGTAKSDEELCHLKMMLPIQFSDLFEKFSK